MQKREKEIYPGIFLSEDLRERKGDVEQSLRYTIDFWLQLSRRVCHEEAGITIEMFIKALQSLECMQFPLLVIDANDYQSEDDIGDFICTDANDRKFKVILKSTGNSTASRFSIIFKTSATELREMKYMSYRAVFVLEDEILTISNGSKVFKYSTMDPTKKIRVIFDNTYIVEIADDGEAPKDKIGFINQCISVPFPSMEVLIEKMKTYFNRGFENCTIECSKLIDGEEHAIDEYVIRNNSLVSYGKLLSNGAVLKVSKNEYGCIEWEYCIDDVIKVHQNMQESHEGSIGIETVENFLYKIDVTEFFTVMKENLPKFIAMIEG